MIEVTLVVTIIGIVAAVAIPSYERILLQARLNSLANDLRVYDQAIQVYANETGNYPDSHVAAGSFIEGMEGRLSPQWKEHTPIGGGYTWIYTQSADPSNRQGYIQLIELPQSSFNITFIDLMRLDAKIDDGNAAEGILQVVGPRIRYYIKSGGY